MVGNIVDKLIGSLRQTTQVSLFSRAIGDIKLDATTAEIHGSMLAITENPIEDGSVIADHAVLEPKEVTITGIVVDYEPKDSYMFVNAVSGLIRGNLDFLDAVGTMVDLYNKTGFSIDKIKQEALDFAQDVLETQARIIAPQLPTFITAIFGDLTNASDERVAKVYAELMAAQKSGEPITVQTGLCTYNNMLISGIGVTQDMDGSAEFSITVREIFIVDTQVIDGVVLPEKKKTSPAAKKTNKKSGKAGPQGGPKVNKGKTQPKAKEDKSILGHID